MTYTQPTGVITATVANVRSGPSTAHPIIAQATQGKVYTITGRNAPGDWFQIACISNQLGWVFGELLAVHGSPDEIPIIEQGGVPPVQAWKGEYFPNRELQGPPAVVRDDPDINFQWGGASPAPGLAGTNFSVRWTRTLYFEGGDYTFYATADDGVRVELDGWTIIDQWHVGSAQTYSGTFKNVGAGNHTITVEYFQAEGDALIQVWWQRAGAAPPSANWLAEYFNDIYLQPPPLVVREEAELDHAWSLGSPDPAVPSDNFSARWTRQVHFDGGIYNFYAYVSDGVRVYVDGRAIIDEWHDTDGAPTYTGQFDSVGGGTHTVIVEYYARGGIAFIKIWWELA
jgi:hypothetical protein